MSKDECNAARRTEYRFESGSEFAVLFLFAILEKPVLKKIYESFLQGLKKKINHPRINYPIRDPILLAGGPWHKTADPIRGHVATMFNRYMHMYIYIHCSI